MRLGLLAVLGVLLSGCGDRFQVCDGACPDLSGTYGVRTINRAGGACEFQPYELAPSLELRQAAPAGAIALSVIDPVSQLFVPVSGEVSVPEDQDPNLIGAFVVRGRVFRPAFRSGPSIMLELKVNGSVGLSDGDRWLSGSIQSTDVESGCFTVTAFTAVPAPGI